jgi:anti-sigma regulatory factor (Ser/Thr protein kinase)
MQIQLRAPQDRELLPSLFAAIRDALARAGISRELAHDVLLVSEEVVCNAIDYGRPPGCQHEVTVQIAIGDRDITLSFRDDGDPFDPLAHPSPDLEADLEDRDIGGLGVHLVRTLADEITYVREARHNLLRVVLLRPAPRD